jgi:hypothetical protein
VVVDFFFGNGIDFRVSGDQLGIERINCGMWHDATCIADAQAEVQIPLPLRCGLAFADTTRLSQNSLVWFPAYSLGA